MIPDKAFQPLATVLEASRILKNKATGLVFVCEFPHATPADCASHSYQRGNYKNIAPQMVHNKVDVVLGGGTSYLNEEGENFLKNNGYGVFKDDLKGFRSYEGNKKWALFGKGEMGIRPRQEPRRTTVVSRNDRKSYRKTLQKRKRIFLDGRRQPGGSCRPWKRSGRIIFPIFWRLTNACGVALDFAKKNGEEQPLSLFQTTGQEVPPSREGSSYSKTRLFKTLSGFKRTAAGLAKNSKQPSGRRAS